MAQTGKLGFLFWTLFFLSPIPLRAELFQWTDARGVVHFTDNLLSVPEPLRGSPELIVRGDLDMRGRSSEISSLPGITGQEPALQPEVASPPGPEPIIVAPPIFYYNPQYFNVVVVNPGVRHPKKKPCLIPEGCAPAFRPNFDDRRYIHPSVFNGGPHQYVHPESSQPARR
jgi:hypothetical protein